MLCIHVHNKHSHKNLVQAFQFDHDMKYFVYMYIISILIRILSKHFRQFDLNMKCFVYMYISILIRILSKHFRQFDLNMKCFVYMYISILIRILSKHFSLTMTHSHTHARTHARMHARTHARTHARMHTHKMLCVYMRSMILSLLIVVILFHLYFRWVMLLL